MQDNQSFSQGDIVQLQPSVTIPGVAPGTIGEVTFSTYPEAKVQFGAIEVWLSWGTLQHADKPQASEPEPKMVYAPAVVEEPQLEPEAPVAETAEEIELPTLIDATPDEQTESEAAPDTGGEELPPTKGGKSRKKI